ncbi:MAG: MlaD family protein [Negativicutes bacterium]|nr:MlaD family protein [Negativicutes bacterium]
MNRQNEIKVGVLTVVAVVLFVAMAVFVGGLRFGDKGYDIYCQFDKVSGLKVGNVVRYAGVDVGRVASVVADPSRVVVTLNIGSKTKIPRDSLFEIASDGLMGEKNINITPPPQISGFIAAGELVEGQNSGDIQSLIASGNKLVVKLNELAGSVEDILGDNDVQSDIKMILHNASLASGQLNALLVSLTAVTEGGRGDLLATVSNARMISENLLATSRTVTRFADDFAADGQTAADIRATLASVRDASAKIDRIVSNLEPVLGDPATAQDLKETLHNVKSASANFEKTAQKIGDIRARVDMDLMYAPSGIDGSKYSGNAWLTVRNNPNNFVTMGATNLGVGNNFNFQIGFDRQPWTLRGGIVDSQLGIGVDYGLGSRWLLSLDAYNPNDIALKSRLMYHFTDDFAAFVQCNDSGAGNWQNYLYWGVRQSL